MGFFQDFKKFALKSNLVDVSVAFVMGAAFSKVSDSFVQGIFTPPLALFTKDMNFKGLRWTLRKGVEPVKDATGKVIQEGVAEVAIMLGDFLNAAINFLIVAFAMFLVIRGMQALIKKEETKPTEPPAPSKEEILLTEIRDAIRSKNNIA
ncbi:MAG TPA: large conductance mechanosensitive channel protein MscL [Cytophagales bacterium]|nr:large conductance mechanosensitive channel protein MscL [Cytophagales bacterium]